jgi:hypothetical protein
MRRVTLKTKPTWIVMCMLVLFGLACAVPVRHGHLATQEVFSQSGDPLEVPITYTGHTWHGKPVYRLTNETGHAMSSLTISSWSEEKLPYLYIGQKLPGNLNLSDLPALSHPPYTIDPAESVWFVAASDPPSTYTVMWRQQTSQYHATVICRIS